MSVVRESEYRISDDLCERLICVTAERDSARVAADQLAAELNAAQVALGREADRNDALHRVLAVTQRLVEQCRDVRAAPLTRSGVYVQGIPENRAYHLSFELDVDSEDAIRFD